MIIIKNSDFSAEGGTFSGGEKVQGYSPSACEALMHIYTHSRQITILIFFYIRVHPKKDKENEITQLIKHTFTVV